jgi:hypothetical protein
MLSAIPINRYRVLQFAITVYIPLNPLMWRGCRYSSLIEKNPNRGELIQLRT